MPPLWTPVAGLQFGGAVDHRRRWAITRRQLLVGRRCREVWESVVQRAPRHCHPSFRLGHPFCGDGQSAGLTADGRQALVLRRYHRVLGCCGAACHAVAMGAEGDCRGLPCRGGTVTTAPQRRVRVDLDMASTRTRNQMRIRERATTALNGGGRKKELGISSRR